MHDPPPPAGVHPHPLLTHPPPPPGHPAHLNGGVPIPTTPGGLSNGSAHGPPHPPSAHIVSPAVVPNAPPSNGVAPKPSSVIHQLAVANEQTWLLIGRVAEQMNDLEHAISAYENALRHNPMSLPGLTQVAGIARIKENYPKAIEYFQRVISMQEDNGEVWSALGHCYLMQDDLQKAYAAYQQALYLLPNPKASSCSLHSDPKLWYGIGILYDRYGSLDHAEEAFASVLKMEKDLDFDKANEILFRLGIIYKQQGKYDESLGCFDRILRNPPIPLAHADIWFQIGHVYEQQKDHVRAKDAYERVVADNPGHAKVLQQLGWLYHQDGSSFQNQELAVQYLTKSLEADPSDAQSWYLLGRAYMAGQKYNKAYEAYQQAVYRDGRNPTFWCSIGVLYFQINQFRDALDAYSRAIRINPYISEVWFDLGSLYESCNNQISDAIDAYARASELDPSNPLIAQRLQLLKNAQATGGQLPAAPGPQDVHPTAYASAVVPPPG
ncbi:TPR-like protein, partial [Coniophora puteana RWD-64-598 SS2]